MLVRGRHGDDAVFCDNFSSSQQVTVSDLRQTRIFTSDDLIGHVNLDATNDSSANPWKRLGNADGCTHFRRENNGFSERDDGLRDSELNSFGKRLSQISYTTLDMNLASRNQHKLA
jgi:hypothetical protein